MRTHFDHEKLEAYELELVFLRWLTPLLVKVTQIGSSMRTAEMIDQLDLASLSALLNTAEGNGRRQQRTRAIFFDDARGSVTECAACLDALVAKGICSEVEIAEGKQLLLQICSMLTKSIALFDQGVREEEEVYGSEDERKEEI